MTKEEFEVLQLDMQQSGKSVKDYLQEAGVNYSTYNYWRKKLLAKDNPKPELAPISFTQHADPIFSGSIPTGATLLFPNGLRAHFGSGTEDVLRDLLDKSGTVLLFRGRAQHEVYPNIVHKRYMKKGMSATPCTCALNPLIFELSDSAAALVCLLMK